MTDLQYYQAINKILSASLKSIKKSKHSPVRAKTILILTDLIVKTTALEVSSKHNSNEVQQ